MHNLFVLTSGMLPPNPSEILGSKTMSKLIHRLREAFDILIFDLPPVTEVSDAAVMAKVTDGSVFVINSRKSKIDDIHKGKSYLEKVNKNSIIGAVLNNAHMKNGHHYTVQHKYTPKADAYRLWINNRKITDETLIRNRNSNKSYLNAIRKTMVRHDNEKWSKVAPYL